MEATKRAYINTDPSTLAEIELLISDGAFRDDNTSNATIRDMTIRFHACEPQKGAIGKDNWDTVTIQDCCIEWNHGQGCKLGDDCIIERSWIRNNGQTGFGFAGVSGTFRTGGTAQYCRMEYNGGGGFDPNDETGNKTAYAGDVTFYRCLFANNTDEGLWFDIDVYAYLVKECWFVDNIGAGLYIEISRWGRVVNCYFYRNGKDQWNEDASNGTTSRKGQVWINNSGVWNDVTDIRELLVFNCQFIADSDGANDVALRVTNRGNSAEALGERINKGIIISSNDFYHINSSGVMSGGYDISTDYSGLSYDMYDDATWKIYFRKNRYHSNSTANTHWVWDGDGSKRTFANWQAEGFDVDGTYDTDSPPTEVPYPYLYDLPEA